MIYIFEGIDRVGKDTLIDEVARHCNKPIMRHYSSPPKEMSDLRAEVFQRQSYEHEWENMGHLVGHSNRDMIVNRFHLGETVYGPRYRTLCQSSVDAIFQDEAEAWDKIQWLGGANAVRLILVVTSSFDHLVDDGGNFNWANKEKEQHDFIRAWGRSCIPKKIIDTYDPATNFYRPVQDTAAEALSEHGWF